MELARLVTPSYQHRQAHSRMTTLPSLIFLCSLHWCTREPNQSMWNCQSCPVTGKVGIWWILTNLPPLFLSINNPAFHPATADVTVSLRFFTLLKKHQTEAHRSSLSKWKSLYKENELLNIFLLIPTALPANIYCMSGLAHAGSTAPCPARHCGSPKEPSAMRGRVCGEGSRPQGLWCWGNSKDISPLHRATSR